MNVEYDIEKEMEKIRKKSDKLLKKYPYINGLESILNYTLSLFYSKSFNTLTKNLVKYVENFDKKDMWDEMDIDSILDGNIDYIDEEFHFLKYSTVLKVTRSNFFRIFGFGDTIIFDHFINLISFNVGILSMKDESEITYSKVYRLTNKIMVLLDDFDKYVLFDSVDEKFFRKLKIIKWDKSSEKLLDKLFSVQADIIDLIIDELFSELVGKIFGNYYSVLEVFAACSSVNRDSDKIEYDDVICAFKTFYKLIDDDIDDLV